MIKEPDVWSDISLIFGNLLYFYILKSDQFRQTQLGKHMIMHFKEYILIKNRILFDLEFSFMNQNIIIIIYDFKFFMWNMQFCIL